MGYAVAHEVGHCLLGPGHSYGADARRMEPQGASEMSRLRLHLTKQEAWKAVARLTLAEPVAQRHQSQTRPAFLRARCKSERLTLLDRLAMFLLPDAVAFTLAPAASSPTRRKLDCPRTASCNGRVARSDGSQSARPQRGLIREKAVLTRPRLDGLGKAVERYYFQVREPVTQLVAIR